MLYLILMFVEAQVKDTECSRLLGDKWKEHYSILRTVVFLIISVGILYFNCLYPVQELHICME